MPALSGTSTSKMIDTLEEDGESTATPKAKIKTPKVDKFAEVFAKLTAHFKSKRSRMYERHIFIQLKKMADKNVLTFVTRLRTAGKYCEFVKIDEEILSALLLNETVTVTVHVLKYASSSPNLLSCKTSEALGLIQIACNVVVSLIDKYRP